MRTFVLCVALVLGLSEASPMRAKRSGLIEYDDAWGPWGQCSHTCGNQGKQTRSLGCTNTLLNQHLPNCLTIRASCNMFNCDDPYESQEWGTCSAECNGGSRQRSSGPGYPSTTQQIDCNAHSCSPIPGCGKADLLFVLDSSGSVGELSWFRTKQFVLDVLSGLTVSASETKVGVVSFSTEVRVDITLGVYSDIAELRQRIWDIPFMAGATATAEAIHAARQMGASHGRDDVKDIVCVVTDGKSNILDETTVAEADQCRAEGMAVFAIGIANIEENELKGIANDPDEKYYFFVQDYEGLHSITNTVVAETCENTNMVECDEWPEWSTCSVPCGGGGTQSRSISCSILDYYGNVLKVFTQTESQACGGDACPTPPPTDAPTPAPTDAPTPPPTDAPTPPPPVVPDCSLCVFHDNTGYMQDPEDCRKYYLCVKHTVAGQPPSYSKYHMACAANTYWSMGALTCITTPAVGCKIVGAQTTAAPPAPTDKATCPYQADPNDQSRYLYNGLFMGQCVGGLVWSVVVCTCVGSPVSQCDNDVFLRFPFDSHFNDVSCNKAQSDVYGPPRIVDDAIRGSCAYFDGQSRLTVPFMYNWFSGQHIQTWSITVWFKREGDSDLVSGIVNNGDCDEGPSFDLFAGNGDVAAGKLDTSNSGVKSHGSITVRKNEWEHLAMVYNGGTLVMYLNGQSTGDAVQLSGSIQNRQCPMNIGHEGKDIGTGYFQGYMDELRIYKRDLSGWDVKNLFENH